MFHLGSGLRCYKCSDYTGRCQNVQECTYEDSCMSLSERGGKTIRQCIRYTDCDNSRLSQMFPAISAFTYRCCSSNLCNSSSAAQMSTPVLALLGSLMSVWWCWT
ncbi:CD59 glycoprotein-like [Cynoglossus semilaevis]|uniref:CD59 glycoprotein-like n=1 Tax=Cynoglossus semilaevis TaxID=244447 RepID=UPI000D6268ED|nr:CD59 glycoprotein-like [Cynoglossus semilaevis]